MYSLTAPIVKNNHILAEIYFIFLKKRPRTNLKVFQYEIWTSVKRSKKYYEVRQILAFGCNLVALILDYNCVKGLRATKIVKPIKVEEVCIKLQTENCFEKQSWTKYLRQTLVFI